MGRQWSQFLGPTWGYRLNGFSRTVLSGGSFPSMVQQGALDIGLTRDLDVVASSFNIHTVEHRQDSHVLHLHMFIDKGNDLVSEVLVWDSQGKVVNLFA
jgi:hypothetical protein